MELNYQAEPDCHAGGARPRRCNVALVTELARLLLSHPGGLRRWTVMRAMRKAWERAQKEVTQKFEDEVERNFRLFSADDEWTKSRNCLPEEALFFRPRDKAGEVWAVHPEQVQTWLAANASKPA